MDDPAMPSLYLNTFAPLAMLRHGREAASKHGLPPFIDGSIRREPDFQHERPAITCLCRAGKFVPRLRVGDHVAYMTKKAVYSDRVPSRRLVAVLRVDEIVADHKALAAWYRRKRLPLPSNCMVPGNPHQPLNKSHRATVYSRCGDGECATKWDAQYEARARKHPVAVICTTLHLWLDWDAPVIHDSDLRNVFGRVPATENPGSLDLDLLTPLLQRVAAPPSSPRTTPTATRSRRSTRGPVP
jgi:hypothetical protein